jgi:glycosyltransferase involved in cell wall biosynthesis
VNGLKLSAVIITYNEQENIGRCVESLYEVADEILVLDSFSEDKTKDICQSLGVRFEQRDWRGYSDTKNYANSLAKGDYIISLDADEALSPLLRDSILDAKRQGMQDRAFSMNRLNNYCGRWIKHGDWYPDKKVRIFKKEAGHWQGSIHEKLVLTAETKISDLPGDLLHFAYPAISLHLQKSRHYAHLVALSDFERGKKRTLVYHGLIKPLYLFVRSYFIKLGFLDGYYGLVIAGISAWERHLRYIKYRELRKALV